MVDNNRNFLPPCSSLSPSGDFRSPLCFLRNTIAEGIVDPGPPVTPIAPDFDDLSYLTQTVVNPTSLVKKKFTISLWFRIEGSDTDRWDIISAADIDNTSWNTTFRVSRMAAGDGNKIEIDASNSNGTNVLNVTSSVGYTLSLNPGWHHLLFSVDLGKAIVRMYIDGLPNSFTINNFVFNQSIPFEISDGALDSMTYEVGGGALVLGEQYSGCLAEIWLAPDTFYDLDQPVNLRYFITPDGKPGLLGASGNIPLGGTGVTLPLIYLHSSYDTFTTNSGSRGDFSKVGALTACFTNPCVGL